MFFAAFSNELTLLVTMRSPCFFLYFLPLIFPLPALIFLSFVLSSSSLNPSFSRVFFSSVKLPFKILEVLGKAVAVTDVWPKIHTTVAEMKGKQLTPFKRSTVDLDI